MTPDWAAIGAAAAATGLGALTWMHPASPLGGPVRHAPSGTVALTFDDGPDPRWTPAVLERLRELDVQASFFVVGQQIDAAPAAFDAIVAAGHLVEVHAARHRPALFTSPAALTDELAGLTERIAARAGRRPRWWRPPFGVRPAWGDPAGAAGLRLVTWSWSAGDHAAAWPGALAPVPDRAITLMHDGPGAPSARERTLAALTAAVQGARGAGWHAGPLPPPDPD